MNVAVIGLGSMGKRRIRLIKQYNPNAKIVGVDLNEQRCTDVKNEYQIEICSSISQAKQDFGVTEVFISTSPLSHSKIINECLKLKLNVFTELNLVTDGYAENIELAKQNGCLLFLSSTCLYRDEIKYIGECVKSTDKPLCYNYHVGQYLPDWHPWESYKNFFISDKKTNGCREIFAVELPWLIECFGDIKSYKVIKNKMTGLDIDYPDNYMVLFEHSNGNKGTLCIDVVARKAVSNFELYGEDLYVKWDGLPDGLVKYNLEEKCDEKINLYDKIDKLGGYSSNIIENAYYNEVQCFFDTLAGKATPIYSFEKDEKILDVISALEGE